MAIIGSFVLGIGLYGVLYGVLLLGLLLVMQICIGKLILYSVASLTMVVVLLFFTVLGCWTRQKQVAGSPDSTMYLQSLAFPHRMHIGFCTTNFVALES